jgi:hypothetical protein
MLLRTHTTIRVKHMLLALIGEMLQPLTMPEDVFCEPIYYGGMDATALKTTCIEDGEKVNVLAVFRVQRPTNKSWQLHLSLQHTGSKVSQHEYSFKADDEVSAQEAVIATARAAVHYLRHCHPDWAARDHASANGDKAGHAAYVRFLTEHIRLSNMHV